MSNPWQLYDDILDLIPAGIRVTDALVGRWAFVRTDDGAGAAMTYPGGPKAPTGQRDVVGKDLRDVAALVKSWDLEQAALGTAAINAALATPERVAPRELPDSDTSTFTLNAERFATQRTATIGPSAPFAPEALPACVKVIAGSIIVDADHVHRALRLGGGMSESRPGLRQFNAYSAPHA